MRCTRKDSCRFTTTTTTPLLVIWTLRLFLLIHAVLLYCYAPTITAMANSNTNTRTLLSKCACGSVRVEIPVDALNEVPTVDCHCPACRKYHVAGLVRYLLVVPATKVSILRNNGSQPPPLLHYQDHCQQLGRVERIQCKACASKLVTRPLEGDNDTNNNNMLLVNMGPLVEDSIPTDLITYWTLQQPQQWQIASKVTWTDARPTRTTRSNTEEYSTRRITGGCACGKCRYEVDWEIPTELQHCYCKLCRRFSGGVYMTWTPVWKEDLRWLHVPTAAQQQQQQQEESSAQNQDDDEEMPSSFAAPGSSSRYLQMLSSPRRSPSPPSIEQQQQQQQLSPPPPSTFHRYGPPPPLKRTSPHGRRHICPDCGGALTIVYDEQPDCIWPAVGGFDDDDSLLWSSSKEKLLLERVIHICCRYKQKWYLLPQDGLPRIAEAC